MTQTTEPTDPSLMSARQLTRLYRKKALSPSEALEASLKAVSKHNPTLNAFTYLKEEEAREKAKASDARWLAGEPMGPLDGVTFTVKDVMVKKGWVTQRGSASMAEAPPSRESAPAVERVEEAGAIALGMTTSPEFGWKGVTDNPLHGITRNPWNSEMTPGGSSGGAAAAAASGMGCLHFGTDGGGSIRIPASFTGMTGLKGTFGRVAAYPLSPFGTVAHVGPLARSLDDCRAMMAVISQPDPRDPYTLPKDPTLSQAAGLSHFSDRAEEAPTDLKGWRIAYLPSLAGHRVDPQVATAVQRAAQSLELLGAQLDSPAIELEETLQIFEPLWYGGAARVYQRIPAAGRAQVDPGFRQIAEQGLTYSLQDYLDAVAQREAFTVKVNAIFEDYDLLVMPTMPITAFLAGQLTPLGSDHKNWTGWSPFTYPFNLTGHPASSQPCGLDSAGLPIGLQMVGPRYADVKVLQAMAAFESLQAPSLPQGAGG